MKKTHLYLLGFLLLGVIASIWFLLFTPISLPNEGYVYYLKPGSSKKLVINELNQQGVIKHPLLFSAFVYMSKNAQLKTGEYRFVKGTTLNSLWKQITTGTGLVYRAFTIVPGWSFIQLRQQLAKTESLRHLTATWDDQQIMLFLGQATSPEGLFFPETYYYTRGIPDLVILKRAHDLMQQRLNEAWRERASTLPYKTPYEALIAASLIEKEAYLDSERPVIGGVLVNRLNNNMLLQIDPTVVYGLGNRYDGKLHKSNLIEDTAYNTYLHKGLPPTPIAIPSMISIQAATNPQKNNYFYFVAKGDGSHQFSSSLAEHNAAVQQAKKSVATSVIPPLNTTVPNETR